MSAVGGAGGSRTARTETVTVLFTDLVGSTDVARALARSRGGHTFTPVGELTLKGFPEPVPACAVAWAPLPVDAGVLPLPGPLAGGGEFAFAGRNRELESLLAAWKEAVRGTQ